MTEGVQPGPASRRDVLSGGVKLGIAGMLGPAIAVHPHSRSDDLAPYRAAKIDWKQAEGEQITVAVIPASYFENLISLQPQFEALTGIKLRFEKVPPGQIRQKALLDLSSKTATYATHAADPMYYPLYVSNKWVEPLDRYLNDADPHRSRRGSSTTTSSRPGAMPTPSTASPTAFPTTAR